MADGDEKDDGESVGDSIDELAARALEAAEATNAFAPEPTPEEAEAQARRVREQTHQERLHRYVEAWGVPFRQAQRILGGQVKESEALVTYRAWRELKTRGGILVLSGQLGSGKTLAAAQAVIDGPARDFYGRAWPSHMHPRFVDIGQIQHMGLFDRSGDFEAICRCSVLAIDDAGREYIDHPGAMRSIMDGLFDRRYRGPGWTIITTNLPRADFARRYGNDAGGGRIMHRLLETGCGFRTVRGDYRQKDDTKS